MLTYLLPCTVSEIEPSVCPKSLYLATLLLLTPPMEGFPWDDLRKYSVDVHGWPGYQIIVCKGLYGHSCVSILRKQDASSRRTGNSCCMTHHSRAATVTFDDPPALRVRWRVTNVNSLSAVEYLFEVRVPVIVYHCGRVATQRSSVSLGPLIEI